MREIIRTLCEYKHIEILEGSVASDHVHLCVKIPPKMSVSEFMGYLKGKSALMIFDKHPDMKYGNRHYWARGYYVDTVGRNEEQIRKYIKTQEKADQLEDDQ
jgi:putative transposase